MRVLWTVIAAAVLGGAGLLVWVQGARFERRVAREARELFAGRAAAPAPAPAAAELAALPAPVRRYLEVSGAARHAPLRAVRVLHRGTFRPGGGWVPIRGAQYLTADPPGFVWWGRIRLGPGVWIDGRDRANRGEGNMLVRAASTFTLADVRGPALDQGALTRLLGELTWMPTALLDRRYVTWTAGDERHARATLNVGGRTVEGTFTFGPDGLPVRYEAERQRDLGGGQSALTPFVGTSTDWREVDGLLVPFRIEGSWVVDGVPRPYARWEVERLELDRPEPF